MRKFLGQVAIVVSLTLAVSVVLALTTGSTGPADSDKPAAASEDTSTSDTSSEAAAESEPADEATERADEAPAEEAVGEASTPDHLDENEDNGDTTTEVLGVVVAQESGAELADTGFAATPVLLVAAAMLFFGFGVHHAGRRLTARAVNS